LSACVPVYITYIYIYYNTYNLGTHCILTRTDGYLIGIIDDRYILYMLRMYILVYMTYAGKSKVIKIREPVCVFFMRFLWSPCIRKPVLRWGGCKYNRMYLYHGIRTTDFQTVVSRATTPRPFFVVVVDTHCRYPQTYCL